MLYALVAGILVLVLWLYLCAPSRERRRADKWRGFMFAHRGLFGAGRPENSLPAFARARDEGYGVEMDIQETKDGQLVVFHDDDALRMAGDKRLIRDMTLAEVKMLVIGDDERTPTFDEVLETMGDGGRLLVEIKSTRKIGHVTRKAVEKLREYGGEYVMESFDPFCLYWLRKNAPEIVRGQLVQGYKSNRRRLGILKSLLLSTLLLNVLARPDFVAYQRGMRESLTIRLQRALFRTPLASWTIREPGEVDALVTRGEMPIFEKTD